jgi:hypothetical protein
MQREASISHDVLLGFTRLADLGNFGAKRSAANPPGKSHLQHRQRTSPEFPVSRLGPLLTLCCLWDRTGLPSRPHGSDGGFGQKASDYSCIPLCAECHTDGPDAYHRCVKKEFEERFGVDCDALVKWLNRIWWKAIHWEGNGP